MMCVCMRAYVCVIYKQFVSLLQVILDVVAMVCFSLILEPLWGLKEFLVSS